MLIIEDTRHYETVIEHAKSIGLYDADGDNNAALKSRLDYLDTYGGKDNKNTRVRLFKDFAPFSFAFVIERKSNDTEAWSTLFNGGLLFHGPHDGHGSGAAPTFAVSLTRIAGWAIHT